MSSNEREGVFELREFQSGDGLQLRYRAREMPEPRAALLVLHGLFENGRRYEELAEFMADAGMSTFVLDHRGHGKSEGRRGHVEDFSHFLDDVDRFRRAVDQRLPPHVPRVLLAHSMGGLIGIRYLERYDTPWQGAIITSPWLETAAPPNPVERALAAVLNRILPRIPVPAGLDPADLSHDADRVMDYRDDPAIFSTLTPRLFSEHRKASVRAFLEVAGIKSSILFLLAGADPIVSTPRTLELADSVPGDDVTIRVLDGYYHEVLQEEERGSVLAEIQAWIEERLP